MKRLNKKGFTLAELLIVIAIIAILIAIAIPAFSASLYSARLQTDHANIRAAYAIARTADMLGVIDSDDIEGEAITADTGHAYVFEKDGTIRDVATPGTGAITPADTDYVLQTSAKNAKDCETSVVCKSYTHTGGVAIVIRYDTTAKHWYVETGAKVTTGP